MPLQLLPGSCRHRCEMPCSCRTVPGHGAGFAAPLPSPATPAEVSEAVPDPCEIPAPLCHAVTPVASLPAAETPLCFAMPESTPTAVPSHGETVPAPARDHPATVRGHQAAKPFLAAMELPVPLAKLYLAAMRLPAAVKCLATIKPYLSLHALLSTAAKRHQPSSWRRGEFPEVVSGPVPYLGRRLAAGLKLVWTRGIWLLLIKTKYHKGPRQVLIRWHFCPVL